MLCLRRISLDAKSRLLFLSRSHSSTNDSMPKSTAISRLIHKTFLQQNGNNSPQAIFVFLQTRGLRTEDKDKSSEDNLKSDAKDSEDEFKFGLGPSGRKPENKFEKYWYRHLKKSFEKSGKSEEEFKQMLKKVKPFNSDLFHFMTLVYLAFMVYMVETDFELFRSIGLLNSREVERKRRMMMIEARSSDEKDKSDAKQLSEDEINAYLESQYRKWKETYKKYGKVKETKFEIFLKKIDLSLDEIKRRLTFFSLAQKGKSNDDSDAKDSEFKFGFGPNGRKPKNEKEEGLYRAMRDHLAKLGKSEEELEKYLKLMDLDRVNRYLTYTYVKPGVRMAVVTYIILTAYKRTLPS
ncbi:hypothetical protein Ddc_16376 [Ditylenchus destructor]|nr:hypothetical protein Ddc_16376 [Ditylenchus destructor]